MGLLEIILIAIGLSMDAFAMSVTLGLSVKKLNIKEVLLPAIYFGFFQALMPLIGFFAGIYFVAKVQSLDHWVAFTLLGIIGGKMIWESMSKKGNSESENPFKCIKILLLAIATSIDALAVGITFAFFEVNILKTIIIIGSITFFITICGVKIGNLFGPKSRSKSEFIGGAVLILLGFKILIEHLIF